MMDVHCPNCQAVYEVDAARVASRTVTFKCSECEHFFRLDSETTAERENSRRWMVREAISGELLYCVNFQALHRWIMEGRVQRADLLSRTGKKWRSLGSIGEFVPVFHAADNIAEAASKTGLGHEPVTASVAGVPSDLFQAKPADADESLVQKARERVSTQTLFGERVEDSTVSNHDHEDVFEVAPAPSFTSVSAAVSKTSTDDEPVPSSGEPDISTHPPRVRLDSGVFGDITKRSDHFDNVERPRHVDDSDDEWTLGDLSIEIVAVDRGANSSTAGSNIDTLVAIESSRSGRIKVGVGAIIVLAIIVGATLFFYSGKSTTDMAVEQDTLLLNDLNESINNAQLSVDQALRQAQPDDEVIPGDDADVPGTDGGDGHDLEQQAAIPTDAPSKVSAPATIKSQPRTQAAATPPQDYASFMDNAKRARDESQFERALQLYNKALEESPGDAAAMTGKGWAMLGEGDRSGAVKQFQAALASNPKHGDAYIGLGRAMRDLGNLVEARQAYDNYLQHLPNGSQASIARFQSEKIARALGE